MRADARREYGAAALIGLAALVLYAVRLGALPLVDRDEPTYGAISRAILQTGNWLTLHFQGAGWYVHPPLYFWLTAATATVLGWSEFTLRLWPAVFGAAGVVMTFAWGRLLGGLRTGVIAGLAMATGLQYFIESRMALLDTMLLFFLSLSLYGLYRAFEGHGRQWGYVGFAAMGLAILSKGPFGLIFPFLALVPYALWSRRIRDFGRLPWLGGVIMALAIGGTWYVREAMAIGRPFVDQIFAYYTFTRFAGVVENQSGPVYYYLPFLLLGLFPWSLFLPAAAARLVVDRDDRGRFLLSWLGGVFLFFTVAQTKLPNYMMPLFPAVACAVALTLDQLSRRAAAASAWTAAVFAGIIGGAAVLAGFGVLHLGSIQAGDTATAMALPVALAFGLTALAAWFAGRWATPPAARGMVLGTGAFLCLVLLGAWAIPLTAPLNHNRLVKPLALTAAALAGQDTALVVYSDRDHGFITPGSYSLNFYSGLPVRVLEHADQVSALLGGRDKVLCMMTEELYRAYEPGAPAPLNVVAREGRFLLVSNADRVSHEQNSRPNQ